MQSTRNLTPFYDSRAFVPNPKQPRFKIPERVDRRANVERPRSTEELNRTADKYVSWSQDKEDEWYPSWNQRTAPGSRDVKDLLDWYTSHGVYRFPEVRTVRQLSRAHTSIYFLMTFRPAADGRLRSRLREKIVFRFVLPTAPSYGLETEIGTMVLAARFSDWVPNVLLYDSSGANPLGLEWLIMEPVEGFILQDCLYDFCACETGLRAFRPDHTCETPTLTNTQKARIHKAVHDLCERVGAATMFVDHPGFQGIGGVVVNHNTGRLQLAPMVTDHFLGRGKSTNWGPFKTVEGYCNEFCRNQLPDMFEASRNRLPRDQIPGWFKDWAAQLASTPVIEVGSRPAEGYTFHNLNIHSGNILVDGDGEIVCVMGWEKAVFMPTAWRNIAADADELFEGYIAESHTKESSLIVPCQCARRMCVRDQGDGLNLWDIPKEKELRGHPVELVRLPRCSCYDKWDALSNGNLQLRRTWRRVLEDGRETTGGMAGSGPVTSIGTGRAGVLAEGWLESKAQLDDSGLMAVHYLVR
ncbi:aminoglycoside 3-phosphotransferase choline kinase domain protein [Colletotrichum sojae]|uniref:Aminoglycoside 3-phosphotransferase choline kinase domain protein n=1 Tax=Colletotrichum sojae TaxID=2175907 RepID=A0A8H6J5G4_9PEZI|nr:aminoglycoside 3-phosphotransferase choline kinase domain protein [Colletotrichum sojae]